MRCRYVSRRFLLFVLGVLPCAGGLIAAGLGSARQAYTPDLEAIRQVTSGIIAADNVGDAEAVVRFYAEDAVLLPPNDSPVVGKAAIRARYKEGFRRFRFDISSTSDETEAFGEWAFDRGTTSGRMVPKGNEAPRKVHDKYVMILHKRADGSWKIARLIWNSAEPATPGS